MIIIVVVSCCVVLPLMIVWLTNKRKNHEIDKKTEILTALLEKNPNLDPAEVMDKLNMAQGTSGKNLKQKLLEHLLTGCICLLIGIVLLVTHLFDITLLGDKALGIVGGGVLMAVGIANIIYYFVSKKTLGSELEAEKKQITEQQLSE